MNETDTRRRSERTDLVLKVEYAEAGALLVDYLTDLSRGGLFICTPVPFEVGQTIDFSLSFPGLLDKLDLSGIVRWRNEGNPGGRGKPTGVGVEFLFRTEEQRRGIDRLMEKCRSLSEPAKVPTGRFRILLVEDNQFTHELFRHALKRFYSELPKKAGLQIVDAVDGQQALERLAEGPVDLAVVDYFLPVMNGGEIIRRMRADPKLAHIPIMVVSVGGEGVREDALAAGADLFVDKPIMLKQLLNTLHVLLSSHQSVGGGP